MTTSDLARGLRKIEPSGSKGSDFDFSRLSLTALDGCPPAPAFLYTVELLLSIFCHLFKLTSHLLI